MFVRIMPTDFIARPVVSGLVGNICGALSRTLPQMDGQPRMRAVRAADRGPAEQMAQMRTMHVTQEEMGASSTARIQGSAVVATLIALLRSMSVARVLALPCWEMASSGAFWRSVGHLRRRP